MDLRRIIVFSILYLCPFWVFSTESYDNLGIAFVHGTGDYRQNALGNYWKQSFINSLASALPNPENNLVVHCNFNNYMWSEEASGCLADQLLEFINNHQITQLIVYTHSDGGNVMRWILSNPTFDPRFVRVVQSIKQVIALAPSSGGTPLADEVMNGNIFDKELGWLMGYHSDSVKQQRIGDMALYNDEMLLGTNGRPSLPRPFRVVIGSNVMASPFSETSYCNGFFLNAGLKITQAYLEQCSDGFLNCVSQAMAGTPWFYDWQKTEDNTPLSHNQSRHSCFGLEKILRNDLSAQGVS